WFEKIQKSSFELFTSSKNKKHTHKVHHTYLEKESLFFIQFQDITKEIEHETEIKTLLYTDDLTKLENRSKLIYDLRYGEVEIQSIAIIDINSFKEINDFYGHKIGDLILGNV